jgi:hypothetical protein
VAVVDDLPELLAQASGLGLEAVKMVRPHNYGTRLAGVRECWSVDDLGHALHGLLDKWEASQ